MEKKKKRKKKTQSFQLLPMGKHTVLVP